MDQSQFLVITLILIAIAPTNSPLVAGLRSTCLGVGNSGVCFDSRPVLASMYAPILLLAFVPPFISIGFAYKEPESKF